MAKHGKSIEQKDGEWTGKIYRLDAQTKIRRVKEKLKNPNNHWRKCKICGRPAKELSEHCPLHFEEEARSKEDHPVDDLLDLILDDSLDSSEQNKDIGNDIAGDAFALTTPPEEQKAPDANDLLTDGGAIEALTPPEIYEKLSQYVAGQEEAKRALALSSYWHINRVAKSKENIDYKCDVMLFIGPVGCGKTFSVNVLAEIVSIQLEQYAAENLHSLFEKIDVGSLEPERTKKPLRRLLADRSIVLIENIDGIISSENFILRYLNADKQKSLLNFLHQTREATERRSMLTSSRFLKPELATSPALIVMTGHLPELAQIVRKRKGLPKYASLEELAGPYCHLERKKRDYELIQEITADDLVQCGFLPELIGEITHIVCFEPLSRDDLKTILLETQKSALRQYQAIVAALDCELLFTEEAIDKIVEQAYLEGLGAYRLNFYVKRTLEHIFWRLPELRKQSSGTLRIQVTEDTVANPQEFLCY